MIFDRLEHLPQYRNLNPNLDRLIDYLQEVEPGNIPEGRTILTEGTCWINCNEAALQETTDLFERHKAYIDLQIPLEDGEVITVRPACELTWPETEEETVFSNGAAGTRLAMNAGTFAIFFPQDAHNCGISGNGAKSVRKLVGKARADLG